MARDTETRSQEQVARSQERVSETVRRLREVFAAATARLTVEDEPAVIYRPTPLDE